MQLNALMLIRTLKCGDREKIKNGTSFQTFTEIFSHFVAT